MSNTFDLSEKKQQSRKPVVGVTAMAVAVLMVAGGVIAVEFFHAPLKSWKMIIYGIITIAYCLGLLSALSLDEVANVSTRQFCFALFYRTIAMIVALVLALFIVGSLSN